MFEKFVLSKGNLYIFNYYTNNKLDFPPFPPLIQRLLSYCDKNIIYKQSLLLYIRNDDHTGSFEIIEDKKTITENVDSAIVRDYINSYYCDRIRVKSTELPDGKFKNKYKFGGCTKL